MEEPANGRVDELVDGRVDELVEEPVDGRVEEPGEEVLREEVLGGGRPTMREAWARATTRSVRAAACWRASSSERVKRDWAETEEMNFSNRVPAMRETARAFW